MATCILPNCSCLSPIGWIGQSTDECYICYSLPAHCTYVLIEWGLGHVMSAGRHRGGSKKPKLTTVQRLRQIISSSLTISCTDTSSEVTIPRSVVEVRTDG